jgi:L-asparaginase
MTSFSFARSESLPLLNYDSIFSMQRDIKILKMGGTIEFKDPSYEKMNNLMKLDVTVDAYLKNLVNPHFTYNIETICEKDSRDINEEDLEKLKNIVLNAAQDEILITHGTFTMIRTGKFLSELLKEQKSGKKIILTGAMIPIIGFSVSDAGFNVGFSISAFGSVEPGVYICMNGGIFKPEEVEKNLELLRFE